jgi:hypothetical protein
MPQLPLQLDKRSRVNSNALETVYDVCFFTMDEHSMEIDERLAQFLMTTLLTREVLWAEMTQETQFSNDALIIPKHPINRPTRSAQQHH